jgi:hypothetical protein
MKTDAAHNQLPVVVVRLGSSNERLIMVPAMNAHHAPDDTEDSEKSHADPQLRHSAKLSTIIDRKRQIFGKIAWQECTDFESGSSVLRPMFLPTGKHTPTGQTALWQSV